MLPMRVRRIPKRTPQVKNHVTTSTDSQPFKILFQKCKSWDLKIHFYVYLQFYFIYRDILYLLLNMNSSKQLILSNWSNQSKIVVTRYRNRTVHSFFATLYWSCSLFFLNICLRAFNNSGYHSMDLVSGFLFGPVYQTYRYVALIEMKLKISGAINCELECKYLQFGDYDQLSFLSHPR